jgi:hypothetical protein
VFALLLALAHSQPMMPCAGHVTILLPRLTQVLHVQQGQWRSLKQARLNPPKLRWLNESRTCLLRCWCIAGIALLCLLQAAAQQRVAGQN